MQKQVAVISGGAQGIGRAAVLRFLDEGYFPVILDRDAGAATNTLAASKERGLEIQFIAADLTNKHQVRIRIAPTARGKEHSCALPQGTPAIQGR